MEKFRFIEKNNGKLSKLIVSLIFTIGCYYCLLDTFNWNLSGIRYILSGDLGRLNPISSFAACWNQLANSLGISDFIILNQLSGEGNTAIFTLIVLICFFVITWLLINSKSSWIMMVYLLCPVVLSLLTRLPVSFLGVGLMAAGIVSSIGLNQLGTKAVSGAMVLGLTAVVLTTSLAHTRVGENYIFGGKWLTGPRDAFIESMSELYYGKEALGGGQILLEKRPQLSGTALEVSGDNLKPMYLRGFVGSQIEEDKWLPYDDAFYYRNQELMSSLKEGGFDGLGQLGQAAMFALGDQKENQLEINVHKGSKAHSYLPYELTGQGSLKDYTPKGDTQIYPEFLGRISSYRIKAVVPVTDKWTEVGARLFALPASNKVETGYGTSSLEEYKINESHYNKYVYDSFTFLSPRDKAAIEQVLGPDTETNQHLGYKEAIEKVKKFMDQEMTYTDKLSKATVKRSASQENDSAVSMVLKSKEGFDVQYATLATAMFRYLGIPARYVEGYLVKAEDIKGNKAVVDQKNAHSWTEIYVDGVGFVPVETCVEFYGMMGEADLNIGISNGPATESTNEPKTANKPPDKNNNGGGSGGGGLTINWLKYLVMLLGALLALFFLWKILGWLVATLGAYWAFRKLLKSKDNKVATQAAYQKMTDKDYPISEEGVVIGNRASYSKEEISEEERSLLMDELKNGKKNRRSLKKQEVSR